MYKSILLLLLISWSFIPETVVAQTENSSTFTEDFLPVWKRAEAYTLAVAEAMPEEKYSYKPTPDVFSFGEQVLHIAANLQNLTYTYITEQKTAPIKSKVERKSKKEIILHLQEALDLITQALKTLPEGTEENKLHPFKSTEMHKKSFFLLMRDHMTHHRAQMILYLRMNNINPPGYVGW